MLLLASQGLSNHSIAQQTGFSRPTVLAVRAAFAELRRFEKQAAQEMGQWRKNDESRGEDGHASEDNIPVIFITPGGLGPEQTAGPWDVLAGV